MSAEERAADPSSLVVWNFRLGDAAAISYWRFMSSFRPIGRNVGPKGQPRHSMQIGQSRINSADFASRGLSERDRNSVG